MFDLIGLTLVVIGIIVLIFGSTAPLLRLYFGDRSFFTIAVGNVYFRDWCCCLNLPSHSIIKINWFSFPVFAGERELF